MVSIPLGWQHSYDSNSIYLDNPIDRSVVRVFWHTNQVVNKNGQSAIKVMFYLEDFPGIPYSSPKEACAVAMRLAVLKSLTAEDLKQEAKSRGLALFHLPITLDMSC